MKIPTGDGFYESIIGGAEKRGFNEPTNNEHDDCDAGGQASAEGGWRGDAAELGEIPLPPLREPFRKKRYDPEEEMQLPRVVVNKRPKFMPREKTTKELRHEKQITAGPHFQELLNQKIYIDGGSGRNVPQYSSFHECNFGPEIEDNIQRRGWTVPIGIQKAIIPIVRLKKNDIIASAPTGSGKTAAYLLPVIDAIANHKQDTHAYRLQQKRKPYALITLPTKELAEQIFNDAKTLSEGTDVQVVRTYGEMGMGQSKSSVERGCDIFISTIGRLLHFIRDGIILVDGVRFLILDEADRLLQDENLDVIRSVLSSPNLRSDNRRFLFSATFPEKAMQIASQLLRPDFFIVQVGGANRTVHSVRQTFVMLGRYEKQAYLLSTLLKMARLTDKADGSKYFAVDKTLIFVGHKREANRLAVCLNLSGFPATNINGDRTLKQRHEAIESFVKGAFNILVSTDVASRGLNIPDVAHVINYDLPEMMENLEGYVHRIGRTGRVGNEGLATSFFDPRVDIPNALFYVEKLEQVDQPVPSFLSAIVDQTEEGMRLRIFYDRFEPYAKLNAERRYLSGTHLCSGGTAQEGREGHEGDYPFNGGDGAQEVADYQF